METFQERYDAMVKTIRQYTPNVDMALVDKAVEYKLGARGLRSIVECIMMDAMFEVPSKRVKKFEVTEDYAKEQLEKSNTLG